MNTFPKDYPRTEIQQVLNFVNNNDTENDRLALAIYGLIGYSLGKMFPDAQLTSLGSEQFSKSDTEMYRLQLIKLKQVDPKFADAIDYIKNDRNLITDLENGTLPEWLIPVIYRLVEITLHTLFRQALFKS